MSLSGIFSFVVGLILAIVLLAAGGVVAARYFIVKLTALPEKPTFPNDKPTAKNQRSSATSRPVVTPEQTPTPVVSPKPSLEPGAYSARVTQSQGLVLRDAPSLDSNQIGGIENNEQIVILEESPDKLWQRVRIEGSDREGWVKAGNVERVN